MILRASVTVSAALLTALSTSAATAAPDDFEILQGYGTSACPAGYVCLYDNWEFNGTQNARIVTTDKDKPNLSTYGVNDIASSLVNNTNRVVRIYPHYDYKGVPATLFPGEKISLNGDNGNFNDQASSIQFTKYVVTK